MLSDAGIQQLFTCSFEQPASPLCGMIQDPTAEFNWTVYSPPTPSDPTGPDFAYSGQFYAYIEASAPRQLNDKARSVDIFCGVIIISDCACEASDYVGL